MNYESILVIITMAVEWIMGFIAKKKSIKTSLIPYQNLLIGITVALVEWIITKDFKESLMISGLFAGGIYDLFHNITKMEWYNKLTKKE